MISSYTVTQFFVTRTELVKSINPEVFANFNDIHTSGSLTIMLIPIATYRLKVYTCSGDLQAMGKPMNTHPRHKLLDSGVVEKDA